MMHIEKITISNARKFTENVEIDFGAGATILVAPNGTGKTTIFEAIELALTGEIKRIRYSPDSIIKDGFKEMKVKLDFTGGMFCQANYFRGGNCERTGDYNELFNIENKASLPYLIRLTHLLDQHTNNWFVEQDENEAGDLLSQLPLGKDLQHILSKRTGVLQAITKAESVALSDLDNAKEKQSKFIDSIDKRNSLIIKAELTPLVDIVGRLISINKLACCEEYSAEYNLVIINSYFQKIKTSIEQKNDLHQDLLTKLSAVRERLSFYVLNSELLGQKQIILDKYANKVNTLTSLAKYDQEEISKANKGLSSIEDTLTSLRLYERNFSMLEQNRKIISNMRKEQNHNITELYELNKAHDATIEYIKNATRLKDEHRLLDSEIQKNKTLLKQNEAKMDFQKQWQDICVITKKMVENEIPEIEKREKKYYESKSVIDNDVIEKEQFYAEKKNTLESLNSASDEILNAIQIIRKNLTENQRNCPVCQAKYEPKELIERIENSLNMINPTILSAVLDEKNALKELVFAKEKQEKVKKEIACITTELNEKNKRTEINKKNITENLIPYFPDANTPEEAYIQVEKQISQKILKIKELEDKKIILAVEMDIREIDALSLKEGEEKRAIDKLTARNDCLKTEIGVVEEDIKRINKLLHNKQKKMVLDNISKNTILYNEKKEYIKNKEKSNNENLEQINKYENLFHGEEDAISKIKSTQEVINSEWKQLKISGKPSEKELEKKYEEVSTTIDELGEAKIILYEIQQDLEVWKTNDKFHNADEEIKKQIGFCDEKEYLEILKSSVEKKQKAYLQIKDNADAIRFFLSRIAMESEQVQGQLDIINEPWKRLLKRIVVSPLISTAPLLSNSMSRNKPKAKTSAIIHNRKTDIASIASEAQLADLQLTFMLAMANQFQWTTWKALLLDDPTQHHDLVHASSVFDVLRDYIIDFGYQIMLATHDSMQADYFRRKLENEGVQSKIYQLVTRKGGVVAERMG